MLLCFCSKLKLISSSFNDFITYLMLMCIENILKVNYRWNFKVWDENWSLNIGNQIQWDKLWITTNRDREATGWVKITCKSRLQWQFTASDWKFKVTVSIKIHSSFAWKWEKKLAIYGVLYQKYVVSIFYCASLET